MKYIKSLEDFKKLYEATSSTEFNALLLEFRMIIKDVKNDKTSADYAIFYNNVEITKGNAVLTKLGGNYYEATMDLKNPQFIIKGTFVVHLAIADAKVNNKVVAKIGQTDANKTGIYDTKLTVKIVNKEPFVMKLNDTFKPNVVVLNDMAKIDLDRELGRLENYILQNNIINLIKGGSGLTFTIIGGSSQIPTTYQGGNEKLSQDRANNIKQYMINYFAENKNISEFIKNNAKVSSIMGQTPYIDIKTKYAGKTDQASIDSANKDKATNDANKDKYNAEQFVEVKLSIDNKPTNTNTVVANK
jgi:hypothetical protein